MPKMRLPKGTAVPDVADIAGLSGMGGPLVAILPGAESKARGLENLARYAKEGMPPHVLEALTLLQKKYPRLFGHVNSWNGKLPAGSSSVGETSPVNYGSRMVDIAIDPQLTDRKTRSTAAHELTHAAQSLRRGKVFPPGNKTREVAPHQPFWKRYESFSNLWGYQDNPFEINARQAGTNFADRSMPDHPLTLAREQLKKLGLLGK